MQFFEMHPDCKCGEISDMTKDGNKKTVQWGAIRVTDEVDAARKRLLARLGGRGAYTALISRLVLRADAEARKVPVQRERTSAEILADYLAGLPDQLLVKLGEIAVGLRRVYEDAGPDAGTIPLEIGRVVNLFVAAGKKGSTPRGGASSPAGRRGRRRA